MASEKAASRGTFIVIEGLDRSGKTTQVKRLEAELAGAGRKVKAIRFPGNPCMTHGLCEFSLVPSS